MLNDKAWTVILTLSQDNAGTTHFGRAMEIIENSGQATVVGSEMSLLRKHYQNLKDAGEDWAAKGIREMTNLIW